MSRDDFVTRLVQIAQRITRMDADQAALLEDQIRQEFGGDSPYVSPRRADEAQARHAAILEAVGPEPGKGRMTVSEAARHFSVSRWTVYRLLRSRCHIDS